MSGIIGIINLDGRSVNRELLRQMTDFMTYRGPDAQEIWSEGQIGFGHTMLRTTRESLKERQPFSLDGEVWITADARIDGRKELIGKLKSKVTTNLNDVTDAELILRAYDSWGEQCLEHLIGDFAFAIWDGRNRRLFCARDHFGVKPFYYAQVGDSLIFSNTLNCVRLHPAVSDELNDQAIGDFLLADYNHDPSTTVFVDIKRLPAAHCLTSLQGTTRTKRYWTLPTDDHIRYRRSSQYIDHFKDLFSTAVNDRLRTDSVSIFMSGGLDSSSIAAVAHALLSRQSASFDLQAYTVVYDRLIPDQERYYSGLTAKSLNININYLVADEYDVYERWGQVELSTPEPYHEPLAAIGRDLYKLAAKQTRVVLTGYGGDPALYPSEHYVNNLLKSLRFAHLTAEACQYLFSRRQLPKFGLRGWLKLRLGIKAPAWQPLYPSWLNKDFAARLDLLSRWKEINKEPELLHPVRPEAYKSLTSQVWPDLFETNDPGMTSVTCEPLYPFFDTRLLNYLLAIPPIPWFAQKDLPRMAMRGMLPESVRCRPKAPLSGDPYFERLRNCDARWRQGLFNPTPQLANYVEPDAVPDIAGSDANELWVNARPLSLNYWLEQIISVSYNRLYKEKPYDTTRGRPSEEDVPKPTSACLW